MFTCMPSSSGSISIWEASKSFASTGLLKKIIIGYPGGQAFFWCLFQKHWCSWTLNGA